MSSGRLFDLAVVLVVSGLGYLFGGPLFGLVLLGIGVVLFALARQRREPEPHEPMVPTPHGLLDTPSSSALIQFIRDAYKSRRKG